MNVVISGATGGIGRALSRRFAEEGSNLVLLARDSEKLEKFSTEIKREYKVDVSFFECDAQQVSTVSDCIEGIHKEFDNIDPLSILAYQYDLVCNGHEISSGAIRNHLPELMYKVFSKVGYSKSDVNKKFEGMIKALSYGAPPHGGMAPGIDRIVMLLAKKENIREVTLFPMNQNAQDLLMGAPSSPNENQLKELNIKILEKKK